MNNFGIKRNTTKEQARAILRKKSDAEIINAYDATRCIDGNILRADAVHILCMCYLEFELNDRGLPTRSSMKLGW